MIPTGTSRRLAFLRVCPLLLCGLLAGASAQAAEHEFWFDDLGAPPLITTHDGERLTGVAASRLLQSSTVPADIPDSLREDESPRIVFLSISDGETSARVAIGSGNGLLAALARAVSRARKVNLNAGPARWLKLDIVREVDSLKGVDLGERLTHERSLWGLAFDEESGLAFLPEQLVARRIVDGRQRFRSDRALPYLKTYHARGDQRLGPLLLRAVTVHRFRTASFFTDGRHIVRLYRGNRVLEKVSKDDLLNAARMGARYLTNAVEPEGRFVYIYLPASGRVPKKYNIVRHAGTIYSMLEAYELTHDKELLAAARRAIRRLLRAAKPCGAGKVRMDGIVEKGAIKLGGNALAVVALAKYAQVTGDTEYAPATIRLARWIQSIQSETGEFAVHKQEYPDGKVSRFRSVYYPGECLLAMVRVHAIDPDESWLDTAEKGAQYLINVRDAGLTNEELSHDHWLLYALNELYRRRRNSLYLTHAMRIARSIVQSQNRRRDPPDWQGTFYIPPRSTPTATRAEGLCAAYRLARDFGREEDARIILRALELAAAFQLRTQFRPESALYLDDPQRVLGAFRGGLTNFEIRIDYVQHNISSLLGLHRILGE